MGEPLNWEPLEQKRGSRIAVYREGSIDADEESLSEIHDWAVKHVLKLRDVFGPRLPQVLTDLPDAATGTTEPMEEG